MSCGEISTVFSFLSFFLFTENVGRIILLPAPERAIPFPSMEITILLKWSEFVYSPVKSFCRVSSPLVSVRQC